MHSPRRVSAVLALLALLLGAVPLDVHALMPTSVESQSASAYIDTALQEQALRPEMRGSIDYAAWPTYDITATWDPSSATVQGEAVVSFRNPSDGPLGELVFRLLPNASSIYGGGRLAVNGMWRGGAPVAWTLSPGSTVLTAEMDPALGPGERVEVLISFVSSVPRSSSGYRIYNQATDVTSLAGWYPVLAPYGGGWQTPSVPAVGDANHFATALYDVRFKAPASYTVVATGSVLERYEEHGWSVWRIVSGPARGFAITVSDRFALHSTQRNGVTINYYALPAAGSRSPQEALQVAADSFAVYEARFGAYPYTEFDLAESHVTVSGYEYAGMVQIEAGLRAAGGYAQMRFIVAHETAHEWWHALVGNDPVREPWLDEALATYSVAVYAGDVDGPAAAQATVASFRAQAGGSDDITASALNYRTWAAYRGPVYYQGALFFHALRLDMGDDAFYAMLRQYVNEHRFGIATTRDLTAMAEQYAGRELDSLFIRWFGSPEPGT